MKTWIQSFTLLVGLTLLTGLLYPMLVTGLGSVLWPEQAGGSLIRDEKGIRGSLLLSQKTTVDPKWFWPRPSAADYATLPSGASNLAPSNGALREQVEKQRAVFSNLAEVPAELLLNSGSGLDPHLSVEAAKLQLPRICQTRGMDTSLCQSLEQAVENSVEPPHFGLLGRSRVNVNVLNQILAEQPQ